MKNGPEKRETQKYQIPSLKEEDFLKNDFGKINYSAIPSPSGSKIDSSWKGNLPVRKRKISSIKLAPSSGNFRYPVSHGNLQILEWLNNFNMEHGFNEKSSSPIISNNISSEAVLPEKDSNIVNLNDDTQNSNDKGNIKEDYHIDGVTESKNTTHTVKKAIPVGPLKITIANDGTIEYNGKSYKISTETIREGLILDRRHSNGEIIKSMPSIQKYIDILEPDTPIDFTVLLAIDDLTIPNEEKRQLIINYFINVFKSQCQSKKSKGIKPNEIEEKVNKLLKYTDIDVVYDMKQLSNISFFKTLFSRHPDKFNLLREEKQQLAHLGNESCRYGLGKTIGKYSNSLKSQFLRIRSKSRKLFTKEDDMRTLDYSSKDTLYASTAKDENIAKLYNQALHNRKNETYMESFKNGVRKNPDLFSLLESQYHQNEEKVNRKLEEGRKETEESYIELKSEEIMQETLKELGKSVAKQMEKGDDR